MGIGLEIDTRCELTVPRIVRLGQGRDAVSRRDWHHSIGRAVKARTRATEVRAVAHVEELAADLEVDTFPHNKLFESRERSEERRVGKECRSRWSPHHQKNTG